MDFIEKYWEDPNILHVNCERPRAYFVPYDIKQSDKEIDKDVEEFCKKCDDNGRALFNIKFVNNL
jgi:hypothetical protein